MRVAFHGGHPETSFVIEGDLNRVLEVRESFLRSKEVDLEPFWGRDFGLSGFAGEVFHRAVFLARLVVGLHRRELDGFGISSREIERLACQDSVNREIAIGGHLTSLLQLVRIVAWAERIVAAAVNVNPVRDLEVIEPGEVLLLHRGVHGGALRLVHFGSAAFAKESVGQHRSELLISRVIEKGAVNSEIGSPVFRGREGVDKKCAVGCGDLTRGFDVKIKIAIKSGAIGDAEFVGKILGGGGRDDGQLWDRLAVVFLRKGVADEGLEFLFVARQIRRAAE